MKALRRFAHNRLTHYPSPRQTSALWIDWAGNLRDWNSINLFMWGARAVALTSYLEPNAAKTVPFRPRAIVGLRRTQGHLNLAGITL